MINSDKNPVEWALLLMEMDESQEHLNQIIDQMNNDGSIDEEEFKIQLFHIITHINRLWNSRNHIGDIESSDFDSYSKIPKEFSPIG